MNAPGRQQRQRRRTRAAHDAVARAVGADRRRDHEAGCLGQEEADGRGAARARRSASAGSDESVRRSRHGRARSAWILSRTTRSSPKRSPPRSASSCSPSTACARSPTTSASTFRRRPRLVTSSAQPAWRSASVGCESSTPLAASSSTRTRWPTRSNRVTSRAPPSTCSRSSRPRTGGWHNCRKSSRPRTSRPRRPRHRNWSASKPRRPCGTIWHRASSGTRSTSPPSRRTKWSACSRTSRWPSSWAPSSCNSPRGAPKGSASGSTGRSSARTAASS